MIEKFFGVNKFPRSILNCQCAERKSGSLESV